MFIEVHDEEATKLLGQSIGQVLRGGEVIEMVGDVGAGKTTMVKGIAKGLGVTDSVQSPSFTINRVYAGRNNITLSHYDFYRLSEAGIMSDELFESINDPKTATIIEWGEAVEGVLPTDRLTIELVSISEDARKIKISANGNVSGKLLERIKG